jgi:hypothetical protein
VEQAAVLLPEAMAIDTMRTSDKNKLCKLRPVDLASRAFYKNFWNFNRDLGYTYGATGIWDIPMVQNLLSRRNN